MGCEVGHITPWLKNVVNLFISYNKASIASYDFCCGWSSVPEFLGVLSNNAFLLPLYVPLL